MRLDFDDTESFDSWLAIPHRGHANGVASIRLVTSDTHEGFMRALEEVFHSAVLQRRVAHPMQDCTRTLGSRERPRPSSTSRAPARCAPPTTCPSRYWERRREAARILEEAEPDAHAHLDFIVPHRKRLHTNSVQKRTNHKIKSRLQVVQVFPSVASLEQLSRADMYDMVGVRQEARHFSKTKMDELYDELRAAKIEGQPTLERLHELHLVTKWAVNASLRLADAIETA